MNSAELARWQRATELLDEILALPEGQQGEAVVSLGTREDVVAELKALLKASREVSMLDQSLDEAVRGVVGDESEPDDLQGELIGQWQIGEEIGRGGMSTVYQASRAGQEFQQDAALKILAVGHLGQQFIDGFVRERQILSDLHHPGIARLIDGGLTDSGAPYLVMQHIHGERIDAWSQRTGADLATVSRLMLSLSDAVAYAQNRLVVHQDINPANVLIDEHDQPILIDFGIARLLDHASSRQGVRAFTPRYAAPEQRQGGGITTATDVYGLGRLFQVLTEGHRLPIDLQRILEKATAENPEHRYPGARQFHDDLVAFLRGMPVQAQPASKWYVSRKFIARNRFGVGAVLVLFLSIAAGLGISIWQANIAAQERDIAQAENARANQVTTFLKDLFAASNPDQAQGSTVTARELLDLGAHRVNTALSQEPKLKAEMLVLLGDLYRQLGDPKTADTLLVTALQLSEEIGDLALDVEVRRTRALLEMELGNHAEALALAEEASGMLADADEVPGRQHAALMRPLLFSLAELGASEEAVRRGEAWLNEAREEPALPVTALYDYMVSLANVALVAEQPDRADALMHEAMVLELPSDRAPSARISLISNLSGVRLREGDLGASLKLSREALELTEAIYPPGHTQRARMMSNLAVTLDDMGRYGEAEPLLTAALEIYQDYHGDAPHPRVAAAMNNLGQLYQESGRYREAEPYLSQARDMAGSLFGQRDPRFVVATGNLGNLYRILGEFEQANRLLMQNLEMRVELLGQDHRMAASGKALLAALRLDQARYAEALELCDDALATYERLDYHNPAYLLSATQRRARALAGLERWDEAGLAFATAMDIGSDAEGNAGRVWPETLGYYAEYLAGHDDPAALSMTRQAVEVHRKVLGPDHPDTREMEELLAGMENVAPSP